MINVTQKGSSATIETRISALRTDFKKLQAGIKTLYGDVSEAAAERVMQAMRSAEEITKRAAALAEEAAGEAKVAALRYKAKTQEWADENVDELRSHVQAKPIKSLLIATGIGALLGAIFVRRWP